MSTVKFNFRADSQYCEILENASKAFMLTKAETMIRSIRKGMLLKSLKQIPRVHGLDLVEVMSIRLPEGLADKLLHEDHPAVALRYYSMLGIAHGMSKVKEESPLKLDISCKKNETL